MPNDKANKKVKKNVRRNKRNFISKLTTEAEIAGIATSNLYDSIRLLIIKQQKIENKEGKTLYL